MWNQVPSVQLWRSRALRPVYFSAACAVHTVGDVSVVVAVAAAAAVAASVVAVAVSENTGDVRSVAARLAAFGAAAAPPALARLTPCASQR